MTRIGTALRNSFQCSSASRKFLNSICGWRRSGRSSVSVLFSEPKIPQFHRSQARTGRICRFSALQRAENSSIVGGSERSDGDVLAFQCSSASRKFLNFPGCCRPQTARNGFSALQRAENSSIAVYAPFSSGRSLVSVLFSEPKIPQLSCTSPPFARGCGVSVLFSEPKIPQLRL